MIHPKENDIHVHIVKILMMFMYRLVSGWNGNGSKGFKSSWKSISMNELGIGCVGYVPLITPFVASKYPVQIKIVKYSMVSTWSRCCRRWHWLNISIIMVDIS